MTDLDELAVQLGAVRQRLQDAADGGLARKLTAAIGQAIDPLEKEVRDGLSSHMPDRYAAVIDSELDISRRTYTEPGLARVVVYARTTGHGKRRIGRLDSGILWHPLFGRYPRLDPRNRWFEQNVEPGWWSSSAENARDAVREEITKAVDEAIEEITR